MKERLFRGSTRRLVLMLAFTLGALLPASSALAGGGPQNPPPWYTGMRAFGQSTVEPAVDDMTGQEVFLLTPNGAPFPSKPPDVAQAPLYLVAYPGTSTVDPAVLNCTPTTCDHAQQVYPANIGDKGHDHLVGISNTGGDFNVAWDVELDVFTPQAFLDGAINTRIMTLDQLNAAKLAKDIQAIDIGVVFNCQSVNRRVYEKAMPLSFSLPT